MTQVTRLQRVRGFLVTALRFMIKIRISAPSIIGFYPLQYYSHYGCGGRHHYPAAPLDGAGMKDDGLSAS
jgi:hypothetical protein